MVSKVNALSVLSFCLLSTTTWATPVPVQKPTTSAQSEIIAQETITQPTIITQQKTLNTAPLTNREINLYEDVFAFQSKGEWNMADQLLSTIKNDILVGHVLASRYLHPSYTATDEEKSQWIAHYADHPQSKIFDKKSSSTRNNVMGTLADLRYFSNGSKYISEKYDNNQRYELRSVKRAIAKQLDNGKVSAALSYFNNHRVQKYIDPIDKAQILAGMASQYLYLKHINKARSTALKALKASKQAPLAGWVAGLIAWMDKDMVASARYFTIAANAPYASPWMTSAASYWGARASTRAGLYKDVSTLLAKAVKNQRTFYGIIATKALGYGYDFNWTMPELSAKDKDVLYQYPSGARALALADVHQLRLAEAELFNLPVKNNPALANAAIAMAHRYNLAGYAMRFSSVIENPAGGYFDAGLFPISSWTKHVKQSDTALLNAFIRQESKFVAQAHNKTGATGLMQIMPNTAAFISGDSAYKQAQGRALLSNPKTNVMIGSNYLKHLMALQSVDHDLFGLTIAYNAGPGKFRRWKNELKIDDPLLFIELIPSSETRAFVERVVTNYWVYQMQMGIEPKTLTAVASGVWPKLD